MLWAPVAMILLRIHVALAAAVSIGIYLLARADVLACQAGPSRGGGSSILRVAGSLFTLGIFAGALLSQLKSIPYWRPAFIGSIVFLVASFVTMTNGFGLAPNLLWGAFNTVDLFKSDLGLWPVTSLPRSGLRGDAASLWACPAGNRHRGGDDAPRALLLPVFAAGSILSALGEVTTRRSRR